MHARNFARALGIEENRYTRYERAEVEPTLTLIHRMCELLEASPNPPPWLYGESPRPATHPLTCCFGSMLGYER